MTRPSAAIFVAAVILLSVASFQRAIANPASATALLSAPSPPPISAGDDRGGRHGIGGDRDASGVKITGHASGSGHGGTKGQAADGSGDVSTNVDCNASVRARLEQLGDPNARDDAGSCALDPCGKAGIKQKPLVGRLTLVGALSQLGVSRLTCVPFAIGVTPEEVSARAVRLIPAAGIGLAPSKATLVNIDTIMWVNAPREQTLPVIHMFGHNVSVQLTFAHVDWTFGDGHAVGRDDAGKAYDSVNAPCRTKKCPGYFTHEYLHAGSPTITAMTSWTATFTVDGAGGQAIPGTIPGPSATAGLLVKEARSVLVPNPGDH